MASVRTPLALGVGLLVTISCGGGTPAGPTSPSPAAISSLDAAFEVAGRQPNLTSLVVWRGGAVVRQAYWHGGGPDTPQDVRSVTKSVTSLLAGVALDRGCLQSIDQKAIDLLGSLLPPDQPEKAGITVRHLLTMTSGIGGDELADLQVFNRWAAAPNQVAYAWNQPLVAPAGSNFTYNSGAYHLLSPILTRACGQPTADFARDTLFGPLGVGPRDWGADLQGFADGAAELMLTPNDMVAIGKLVLNEGRVGGRQVVSASWIQASTRSQISTSAQPYLSGYGFGWWTGQSGGDAFAVANGYGGQFIVVVPRRQLVVTAANRSQALGATAGTQWRQTMDIIMQHIVPAFL